MGTVKEKALFVRSYRNAVRLTDFLGARYRNDGYAYFLTSDFMEYGQLEVVEDLHGLEIALLIIYPECRGQGLGFRALLDIAELADRFECPLHLRVTPLPVSGCEVGLNDLETMGFYKAEWGDEVLVRSPHLRRYYSDVSHVA